MSNNDGMIFHCSLGDKIIGTNDGMESIKGRSQEKKFLYKKKGQPQASNKYHCIKHPVEAHGQLITKQNNTPSIICFFETFFF